MANENTTLRVLGHVGLHFFVDVQEAAARTAVERLRPLSGHGCPAEMLAYENPDDAPFVIASQGPKASVARVSALELVHLQDTSGAEIAFDDAGTRALLTALAAAISPVVQKAYAEAVRRGHRIRTDAIAYGADLLLYPAARPEASKTAPREHATHVCWCFPTRPTELQRGRVARLARSVKKVAVAAYFADGDAAGNRLVFEEVAPVLNR